VLEQGVVLSVPLVGPDLVLAVNGVKDPRVNAGGGGIGEPGSDVGDTPGVFGVGQRPDVCALSRIPGGRGMRVWQPRVPVRQS
jgi:hypothetical protein